jgi:hypothetical protein
MQTNGNKRVLSFDEFFSQEQEPMTMTSEPTEMDQFSATHSAEVGEPEAEGPAEADLTMMDEPMEDEAQMDELAQVETDEEEIF